MHQKVDQENLQERPHRKLRVWRSTGASGGEEPLPFTLYDPESGLTLGFSSMEAQALAAAIDKGFNFLHQGHTQVYDLTTGEEG